MRIKSSFRDYYDGVQAQGQDQSLVYLRFPREVELKERMFPWIRYLHHWGIDILHRCQIIGFCGKIYPVLSLHHPVDSYGTVAFCHSLEDVDDFLRKNFKAKSFASYFSNKKWHYSTRGTIQNFFNETIAQQNKYEHIFQENRCPIFIYREHHTDVSITFNGRLKDFQFYRRFDPFTAFQEIQMYLGGIAFPNKPIPKIPDKILAEAKGFDKYSFRKDPR